MYRPPYAAAAMPTGAMPGMPAMMPAMGQPQMQYAAQPQYPQMMAQQQYNAPAVTAPAVTQAVAAAPAMAGPRVYTPQGAEMLQVTVFGTKQLPGANVPSVEISIDGKPHKHNLDTLAITGPQLSPKTLITYYLPGENLNFIVSEGGMVLGDVQISGQDFHPNGLEGDLPLMDPQSGQQGPGYLMVKIVPLGISGKMEDLAPVHIQAEAKPLPADPAPYVASSGVPRACSPDEWQRLGEQGAQMIVQEGPVAAPQPQPVMMAQPQMATQPQVVYAQQQVQYPGAAAAAVLPTQAMPQGYAMQQPGVFRAPQQTYVR